MCADPDKADAAYREYVALFTRRAFRVVDPGTPFEYNWHLDCIGEHLNAVHCGDIKRLIINMPPRSLKSISVSVAFPAWLLGRDPSAKVIVGSYAQDLALKHSVDTRFLLESPWYRSLFPATTIAGDQNEKRKFQTTERGHRISCSVGSGITGEGGDYLIVDDPHNPMEALSDVQREVALTWFDQTFISRQNDKRNSRIIVVMQRLHTRDLTGHLLEKGGWHHLCLPAVAKERTVITVPTLGYSYTREEGEYLHAKREGKAEIEQLRNDLGSYAFAGQYMQSPAPEGGGEFKLSDIQYYENVETFKDMNIYILVDPANEKKESSDYTAMVVIGLGQDQNYYLLDIVHDKLNGTESTNALIRLHKKWNKKGGKPPIVGYEKYGASRDIHYIQKEQNALNYRFPIIELGGQMKKNDRIRRLVPLFQRRQWWFPVSIMYQDHSGKLRDLIKILVESEMLTFPVGDHDDILDSMARICEPDLNASFPRIRQAPLSVIPVTDRFVRSSTNNRNPDWLNI